MSAAPFAFRKKTPKKRRPREEPTDTQPSEPIQKKHRANEDAPSQKVPSRPPPRQPTDTPGPPPKPTRAEQKKSSRAAPIPHTEEPPAPPKRGSTTSAQNLVLDTLVLHPPVAVAAFLKPHLREIAEQVCKEVGSIPAIPRPPSSKDSSTNEAALTVLRQSERNLDSLLRRYEEERDQWEKAKTDILEKLAVNERKAKKVNSLDNAEGSPSQDGAPLTPFQADQFASLISNAASSVQQLETYCRESSTWLNQHADKLSRYNLSSQVEQQDPKLLVQSIGSASKNS